MSFKSIDSNHMEDKYDEYLEDQRKTKIIGTNQIIILKETSINLMSQLVMKIFIDRDYTIS
jgi:hypothetical protein